MTVFQLVIPGSDPVFFEAESRDSGQAYAEAVIGKATTVEMCELFELVVDGLPGSVSSGTYCRLRLQSISGMRKGGSWEYPPVALG